MTLTGKKAAIALLLIQSGIALSVAAVYALDRATKPRVWVRTQQVDPSTPLRGRYLALQLAVDGCSLAGSGVQSLYAFRTTSETSKRVDTWPVTLHAENGRLIARALAHPSPDASQFASLTYGQDCHTARLDRSVDIFLPEHAAPTLPRARDTALWVEVTVPATGPPRPIQLAVADATGWHLLKH